MSNVVGGIKFDDVVGKILGHGISQGAMTAAQGGKFSHGFFSAAFTAGFAPGIMQTTKSGFGRIVASSVIGGTASVLGGGKFANGAVTGAYVMMFNHMSHPEEDSDDRNDSQTEKPSVNVEEDINNNNGNGIPDALGPALILSGQKLIPKPFAGLGSGKFTSIASKVCRNIPGKLPFRFLGTRGLGAALGRLIPYVGVAITFLDVVTTPPPMIPPANDWHPPIAPADNTRIVKPIILDYGKE